MTRIPALALILTAAAVSAVSCSAGADDPQTRPEPANAWADEVYQLQQEITSERGDGNFTESRMGGGAVSAGEETSLRFHPIVSGPIAASFLCDTGTVSLSITGGPRTTIECGQVQTFSGVQPYEFDAGLMVTVGSEQDARWAVEFRSGD
ncbi:hypothetical protein [Arthrobacter sp. ZGTC212]|uniref:hypothetical protein n=1 Tax=Arthrobacter sp. ZGTC212 TaxID=2058899 RepID=UPI000CE3B3D5|nr:hypothetical protein [Arthrobacter sp. ZGTC212]